MRFGVWLVVPLGLAGCVDSGSLGDVKASVREQLNALPTSDADLFMSYIARDWVDLGGGDGSDFDWEARRDELREDFAGASHRSNYQGHTPESLLRMGEGKYLRHEEYSADPEYDFGVPARFQPQEQDILVSILPHPNSPLHDGWFGYYRPAGDRYAMVAGD